MLYLLAFLNCENTSIDNGKTRSSFSCHIHTLWLFHGLIQNPF